MWRIIVLCTIMSLTVAEKFSYKNYKVFNFISLTKAKISYLKEQIDEFFFWEEPPILNKESVSLMIAPHKLSKFYQIMRKKGISYQLLVDNVQELVNRTTESIYSGNDTHNLNIFPFNKYPTLNEIYDYINNLTLNYNDKVKIVTIGETYEGNKILGVEVSFNNTSKNPGIFLEGGIHGNEWISPATVIYILNQLLTSTDPNVRAMAENHDWYIVPLVNPDGYNYTHTTDRLWKKSRARHDTFCIGVDLNRNWNYTWSIGTDVYDRCSNEYAGSQPFSELETHALKNYLETIAGKFYAYISFHGSSQLLIIPYGKADVDDYREMYTIGLVAITALRQRYGTEYRIGNKVETAYFIKGSSTNYVRNMYKNNVYTYYLRDLNYFGCLLPPDQIIPTGQETLDSLVTMFKQIDIDQYPLQ
ncbi:zinc carboxypeptidase-like [Linepithema humile]|uniref:zinc carboxypeptidase-like n=1 Tax=Linepithema humile TaxID=83485 RepID=UPI0006232FDC|nr:PREDICTED: zinc carboxypeptidase-like [Linepithema humile]